MTHELALWLMRIAGGIELSIAAGSIVIPRILNWNKELAALPPLMRRLFWVYAGYIFTFNLLFGALCLFGAPWLLLPHPAAACLLALMAVYWTARVLIQFFLFRKAIRPTGFWYDVADWSLTTAFVLLSSWFCWSAAESFTRYLA